MDIFRNKKRTVLSVADEHSHSPKSHKKKKDGSSNVLVAKPKKELQYQYSDEEVVSSSSDSQPSSNEDTDTSGDDMNQASQTQRTLARRLTRREKQREELIRKKKEQNKISMDDFLNKQVEFHTWIEEEKHKIYNQMSSPKKKVYFKTFMKLWNKRKLPQKYYRGSEEIQSPHLSQNTAKFNVFDEPDEFSHLTAIKRPKSKRLSVENGGFLDSPFSTFGKTPPKMQHQNSDKENSTPVRPLGTFASPRTNKNSHVSPILELSEYQIPLNSVRIPSLSSNEDISCAPNGRMAPPYSVMPLPWVTDSDTSSIKSEITDDEDHSKTTKPVTSVVYALPRKIPSKKPIVQAKKSSQPPPVPPKPRSGLVNYSSSVDSNSGYNVIYPRSVADSVSIGSDQSGDYIAGHRPMVDCHVNRSSMSDPGQRNVYQSLDSISLNSAESDPGYRVIPPVTDEYSVKSMSCSSSVIESDEELPLPPPPEIPSLLLDYTQSDLPPPPDSSLISQDLPSVPMETIQTSLQEQNRYILVKNQVEKTVNLEKNDTMSTSSKHAETRCLMNPPVLLDQQSSSGVGPNNGSLGWCRAVTAKPYTGLTRTVSKVSLLKGPDSGSYNSLLQDRPTQQREIITNHQSCVKKGNDDVISVSSLTTSYSCGVTGLETGHKGVFPKYKEFDPIRKVPVESAPSRQNNQGTVDVNTTDRVVSPGYVKLDAVRNAPSRQGSPSPTETGDRVVPPGHVELDAVRKNTVGTDDRVVPPGYMEFDAVRNTTSRQGGPSTTETGDRVVPAGYVDLDTVRNTTSRQGSPSTTVTSNRVMSPGYVELESINSVHSENSTTGASPLPVYAVPMKVCLSSLPTHTSAGEDGGRSGTESFPSDYLNMDVRSQKLENTPGSTGKIHKEPDVEISPNVTTRRGRRRKTLRQGNTVAMDSCPTLEELNLSRDIQDPELIEKALNEGSVFKTEDSALSEGQHVFSHLSNTHHSIKSDYIPETHSSSFDIERCRTNSLDTDLCHKQGQYLNHLESKQNIQDKIKQDIHPTGSGSMSIYCSDDVNQQIHQQPLGSLGTHQQPLGSLGTEQQPQGSCSTDQQPKGLLSTAQQPQGLLSTDKQPQMSCSTAQQPQGSQGTEQQPLGSLGTNQQQQGSISTNQQPQMSCSTNQQQQGSRSTEQQSSDSSRIKQTFHPTNKMKTVDSVFPDCREAGVSLCGTTESPPVIAPCNLKTIHQSDPQKKRGHVRNPSLAAPKWASNCMQNVYSSVPPSKGGPVRNPSVSTPSHVNVPNNVKSLHNSHPPPKIDHLKNTSLFTSQQMTPCSLTVLTQSPRKIQNFRDRLPSKKPVVNKDKKLDILICHSPHVQDAPKHPNNVNSQDVRTGNAAEHRMEMLETDIDNVPVSSHSSSDKHIDLSEKSSETIIW